MRMGRAELMRRAVGSAKCDRNIELPAGHREHVGRVVHNLVERDERKAEGHELNDWSQTDHGSADSQTSETILADRRIDDSFGAEAFEQSLTDFVSAVIFGDFLAHEENVWITLQFFHERFVECLTISNFSHAVGFLT